VSATSALGGYKNIGDPVTDFLTVAEYHNLLAALLMIGQTPSLSLPTTRHTHSTIKDYPKRHHSPSTKTNTNRTNASDPTMANLATPDTESPPHVNVPEFRHRPAYGSWNTGLVASSVPPVIATSPAGGYPDVGHPPISEADLTSTEYRNILKLFSLIWTHNDKEVVKAILLYVNPNYNRKDIALYLACLFGDRFTGRTTNLMYRMIEEAVEIRDLGVTLRSMARLSVRCGIAAVEPCNTPAEGIHYLQRGTEYFDDVFDLRSRATTRLDELMADPKFKSIANGAIQVKRLKDIKISIPAANEKAAGSGKHQARSIDACARQSCPGYPLPVIELALMHSNMMVLSPL
jgi:hypothetical protein